MKTSTRGGFARWIAPAAAIVATVAATLAFAAPASAVPDLPPQDSTMGYGPVQTGFLGAFAHSIAFPLSAPVGANDPTCKPSAEHPRPVILVHGTFESAYNNFAGLSPALKDAGYCVFALNYTPVPNSVLGFFPFLDGTGDIVDAGRQIQIYTDYVLNLTGATQVDMVGHSQGGVAIRQYLKFNGGATPTDPSKNKVKNVIGLGATNNGTTLIGIGALGRAVNNIGIDVLGFAVQPLIGVAGVQQVVGSDFLNNLNAGGYTFPGIDYTNIGTRYDEVTTPYTSTFFEPGPGATVRNLTLQDGCSQDLSDHLSMMYSPRATSLIEQGLNPTGNVPAVCAFNAPLSGSGNTSN